MRKFTAAHRQDFKAPQEAGESKMLLEKIVDKLLQEDKAKLMTIIRNLNAKYEYSHLAQYLLAEVLPQFDHDDFLKDFEGKDKPAVQDLKQVLEGTLVYQDRHYGRADRFLKTSYFIDHVVSQMTLQEEKAEIAAQKSVSFEKAGGAAVSKRQLKKR